MGLTNFTRYGLCSSGWWGEGGGGRQKPEVAMDFCVGPPCGSEKSLTIVAKETTDDVIIAIFSQRHNV